MQVLGTSSSNGSTNIIEWMALPHCPENQLTKAHPLDAGFDIRIAETAIIKQPNNQEFKWEYVAPLISLPEEDRLYLEDNPNFKIEVTKVEYQGEQRKLKSVFRKKFKTRLIKTGICINPNFLCWTAILPRSSTSRSYQTHLANSVGVVDLSYNGPDDELFLALQPYADTETIFFRGERVAQLIPINLINPVEVKEVQSNDWNNTLSRGGFGSTGRE